MSYNSKRKGEEIEALLDKVADMEAPDAAMSDTSENSVQNKVVKEYIDLHPQYVEVEDATAPDNAHSPVRMRLRFIDGYIYLDSDELISGKIELARLGRSSSRHKDPTTGKKRRILKHGWRIYRRYTKKTDNSSHILEEITLGTPTHIRGHFFRYPILLAYDGDQHECTPMELMGCFGIALEVHARVRSGHHLEILDAGHEGSASQKYAFVINGVYLPFELTATSTSELEDIIYSGSPLSI